ncbi:MAG: acetyl-CoA carboxylase biotin carboxylase subunit [candidate division Zixibacteria bacterium]|nr:acetyl-CoA carboxylase biotin carboxylase subunit [candidate division Zixibacteria bacterium]
MFKKILVANRSEIAVRVMNACRVLGIPSVAVYSDADENAKHRHYADEAVHIGPPPPRESYLDIDKIIAAAKETGCDAIHPGYGFLAENPLLPRRCAAEGIAFIGPSPEAMNLMGNKVESRIKMTEAGIPLVPGMKSSSKDPAVFRKAADKAGYPVMIKAAAGGGGKGMRIVHKADELDAALEAAQREALNAFNDDTVYLEKYIASPRHIEFQVIADSHGNAVHLFERECSIQRRHQKIIEETPSVALTPELRARMGADAVKVAQAADYVNAGTVEFLFDPDGNYYFLEMNTRIQVEHPITEMVTGIDLVVEQIRVAAGLPLSFTQEQLNQRGHAIECRLYAEDGDNNFMPSTGKILHYSEPSGPGIRVDSGVMQGGQITIDYDPIMAKLIVHAPDRATCINKTIDAIHDYKILGVKTSRDFMVDVLRHPDFVHGNTFTDFIEKHMGDRDSNPAKYRDLAAAVATAAAMSAPGAVSSASSGNGVVDGATPWQTIGPWQIGDSISAKA